VTGQLQAAQAALSAYADEKKKSDARVQALEADIESRERKAHEEHTKMLADHEQLRAALQDKDGEIAKLAQSLRHQQEAFNATTAHMGSRHNAEMAILVAQLDDEAAERSRLSKLNAQHVEALAADLQAQTTLLSERTQKWEEMMEQKEKGFSELIGSKEAQIAEIKTANGLLEARIRDAQEREDALQHELEIYRRKVRVLSHTNALFRFSDRWKPNCSRISRARDRRPAEAAQRGKGAGWSSCPHHNIS
jgi:chromosome segregation ATPase